MERQSLEPRTKAAPERYNRHPKTLERWEQDPRTGFPKARKIRGRWYYNSAELDAWERSHGVPA